MREPRYHGGFDHPVRSFLIGVTLLVLLFAGFVVGVEAGSQPSSSGGPHTITLQDQRLRVVTVQQPVVRTTIGGATTIVSLLGPDRRAAVVKDGHSTLVGYLSGRHRGPIVAQSAFRQTGTIFVPEPTTVTETVTDGGSSSDTNPAP